MRITLSENTRSSHPIRSQALGSVGWILLAVTAALFIWLIAVPILDTSLVVEFGAARSQTVTPALIAVVVTVAGLVAWGLMSMLKRLAKGGQIWRIVAATVLALSLLGPVFGGTTPATKVTLILMHLIVAGVLIPGLPEAGTTRGIPAGS